MLLGLSEQLIRIALKANPKTTIKTTILNTQKLRSKCYYRRTRLHCIGGGMGVAKGPWPHLKVWGRGQRILWPHLNFSQIFTKIDLTLMIICEKKRNSLNSLENLKCYN